MNETPMSETPMSETPMSETPSMTEIWSHKSYLRLDDDIPGITFGMPWSDKESDVRQNLYQAKHEVFQAMRTPTRHHDGMTKDRIHYENPNVVANALIINTDTAFTLGCHPQILELCKSYNPRHLSATNLPPLVFGLRVWTLEEIDHRPIVCYMTPEEEDTLRVHLTKLNSIRLHGIRRPRMRVEYTVNVVPDE